MGGGISGLAVVLTLWLATRCGAQCARTLNSYHKMYMAYQFTLTPIPVMSSHVRSNRPMCPA